MFIDQFQLRSLEGETALQKIYNAMSPEEARDAVSSAVISYLIPFALDQENIIPMTSSSVDAESDPVEGKEFTFNVTILPKPEFELTSYDPVEVSVLAPLDVTEQDIDMQMHMLASQFATVKVDPETGEEETIIPEVTDEWVETNLKGMGVTTVEELRKQFRATSEKVKEEQLDSAKANAVMAGVGEALRWRSLTQDGRRDDHRYARRLQDGACSAGQDAHGFHARTEDR